MLFVFVAQADAAASCAATCVCGIAAATLPLTVHRCWTAVATRTLFFLFAALPHIPTSLLNF